MPRRSILLQSPATKAAGRRFRATTNGIFCKNPVYYVARAYGGRYASGMRGDKATHGDRSRNALDRPGQGGPGRPSNGLRLYGPHGDGSCCLHIPAAVMRLRAPSRPCLPGGVGDKEVDQCPAYSVNRLPRLGVEDPLLVERTRTNRAGARAGGTATNAFVANGHQTVVKTYLYLLYLLILLLISFMFEAIDWRCRLSSP